MSQNLILVVIVCLVTVIGCAPAEPAAKANSSQGAESGHTHSHDASDVLTWIHENIRPTIKDKMEYELSYGYHGKHFHAGDTIEPAVSITKNGEDYSDAKCTVQLALLDPGDASKVIEQLPGKPEMNFEPKTEEEPAHYAQAELHIPNTAKVQCQLQFHVELEPGESVARTIILSLGH